MTRTLTVRGFKIRTRTARRYVVIAVMPGPHTFKTLAGETYTVGAGVEILRRTDALAVARTVARRYGFPTGRFAVVVDTTTGEEV